ETDEDGETSEGQSETELNKGIVQIDALTINNSVQISNTLFSATPQLKQEGLASDEQKQEDGRSIQYNPDTQKITIQLSNSEDETDVTIEFDLSFDELENDETTPEEESSSDGEDQSDPTENTDSTSELELFYRIDNGEYASVKDGIQSLTEGQKIQFFIQDDDDTYKAVSPVYKMVIDENRKLSAEEVQGDSNDTVLFASSAGEKTNGGQGEENNDDSMETETDNLGLNDQGAEDAEDITNLNNAAIEIESFTVEAANVSAENTWSTKAATFTLSYEPSTAVLGQDVFIQCSITDEATQKTTIQVIDEQYYTAEDGVYTLVFDLIDAEGTILKSSSEKFEIQQDTVNPTMIIGLTDGYGLIITGIDATSGAVSVSVDGGESWSVLTQSKIDDTMKKTYKANAAVTLKAGQIKIQDAAGNITSSLEDVKLITREKTASQDATQSALTNALKGMTSKSTGKSRSVSHSRSSTTLISAYDGVDLILYEAVMNQLVVGDDVLDL
ncbi:MAG: hypothetical protein IJV02_02570, partial [Candidatus Methanomethylophilaceae archaeon]|nr:hypothetical protein [Candidatus Methanomethylophilaceae archaeon]